jgi:formyltetrahydrofolate deformylase
VKLPVLRVVCPDRPGLIHTITKALADVGANIARNDEFVDMETQTFFMRTAFAHAAVEIWPVIEQNLRNHLPDAAVIAIEAPRAKRIMICATREYHCLGDLLLRHHFGDLNAEIIGVISNHDTLCDLVTRFGIPYHHVPHDLNNRAEHEKNVLQLLAEHQPDYIVLAKYMLILSPNFVKAHAGRLINIHHSFLPAFIGAKPYAQAFARGVKMIGATAHFVTDQLDEGPIIAQQVISVDHNDDAQDMAKAGREVEVQTLARALKMICDNRVFINNNKTIVF